MMYSSYSEGSPSPSGGIIVVPSDSEVEHDHSFHFTATGTDAGTVSDGYYRHGDADAVEITPAALIDTTSIVYYVQVDWSTNHTSPLVTWENLASFPAGSADIWIYPIYTFDSNGNCKEHRQTDIQLPEVYIPAPPSRDCILWFDNSASQYKYTATAPTQYMVLQYTGSDTVDFDYVRQNPAQP